jgi:hypothetical protein
MKAKLFSGGDFTHFYIQLEPETIEEENMVKAVGKKLARTHIIGCDGFEYMQKGVEFQIRPYPTDDR